MGTPELPSRIFTAGEEPSGYRVNSYHKVKITQSILKALSEDELDFFRTSSFSKIIAIEENPPFSGAFCYFILARRLKINKKYELWVIFAGAPYRISLREFAIVTGLNCGRLPNPKNRKTKNPINEKPYWNELFGSLKSVSVGMIVEMLKNKTVRDRDTRLKFAALALVTSVLLPSSHTPKINPQHVEMIRNLDEFMAYPWGRLSFQELMSSLLKKDEIALAQDSFALRGYVEAIQLVMIAAIPSLKEEITPTASFVINHSDSEGREGSDQEENVEHEHPPVGKAGENAKYALIPAHAKIMDLECKVRGFLVLPAPHEEWELEADLESPDELEDQLVDRLVELVASSFRFKKKMFKGGVSESDLLRMRSRKRKSKSAKERIDIDSSDDSTEVDTADQDANNSIANLVSTQLKEEISGILDRVTVVVDTQVKKAVTGLNLDQRMKSVEAAVNPILGMEARIANIVADKIGEMQAAVIDSVCYRLRNSVPANESNIRQPPPVAVQKSNTATLEDTSNVVDTSTSQDIRTNHPQSSDALDSSLINDNASIVDPSVTTSKIISDIEQSQVDGPISGGERVSTSPANVEANTITPKPTHESTERAPEPDAYAAETSVPISQVNEPSFSLGVGVSQVGRREAAIQAKPIEYVLPGSTIAAPPMETRKSKRPRVPPAGLEDFKCDTNVPGGLTFMRDLERHYLELLEQVTGAKSVNLGGELSVSTFDFLDIALRSVQMSPKVMDSLMAFIRSETHSQDGMVVISDTNLPATLMANHSRFVKTAVKERSRIKFSGDVLSCVKTGFKGRLYFPFNIDQQHWVGVCVDFKVGMLHLLDCNTSLMSDNLIRKELTPIANMLPYLSHGGAKGEASAPVKAFTVGRCKGIPQTAVTTDSAVMTVLLIEAHNGGGVDACRTITPRVLSGAAKQLLVRFSRHISMSAKNPNTKE